MRPALLVAFTAAVTEPAMANDHAHTPPVVVETGAAAVASVIWLHGLGADGYDFEPIVPELRLPVNLPLRFIFPHAPLRPVTLNNGYVMRAWYDLALTESGFSQNPEHLRAAVAITHGLIAHEGARGIGPDRIVLAGFSQGGAVAIHAGLHFASRLAGILCLSAPIPFLDTLLEGIERANAATPIFLGHGEQDSLVPLGLGLQARERLTAAGLPVAWHQYAMDHGVCPAEVGDIGRWLRGVLGAAASGT